MDATCVENVATLQGFHLGASPEHFKANRATDLLLLSLDFFALSLRETVLLLLSGRGRAPLVLLFVAFLRRHTHGTFIAISCFLKLIGWDRIYDILDFILGRQRLTVRVKIFITIELVIVVLLVNVLRELSKQFITLAVPVKIVLLTVFVYSDLYTRPAALGATLNIVSVSVRAIDGPIVRILSEDGSTEATRPSSTLVTTHEL